MMHGQKKTLNYHYGGVDFWECDSPTCGLEIWGLYGYFQILQGADGLQP